MTATLLRELLRRHAFNSTPSESELGPLHLPFDQLTGELRYEQVLAETLRRGERVALIGPSGSGKSSVTAHVLGGFVHDLAPIRVRVGLEPDAVSTDPAAFTRHLVRTVAKHIEQQARVEATRRRADQRRAEGHVRAITRKAPVKRPVKLTLAAGAPWLQGQLAVELGGLVDTTAPSGQDVLSQAQQILAIITAWDLRPVLVLDDTDHWLVRPGLPAPDALLAGFFGRIIRLIAEQLPAAAAVIAVHETYLHQESYREAGGFLESRIVLPAVPDAAGLGLILSHRVQRILTRNVVDINAVIAPDALELLHRNYISAGRSLRNQLQLAHSALTHACDSGAPVIEIAHLDQAIGE